MKKLIILLIIIASASYGQNTGVPGKDYFPYMSFWDFAVYVNHPTQEVECSSSKYQTAMDKVFYYYPLLKSLGLTNICSDFELINTLGIGSSYDSISFLDMDFEWAADDAVPFAPGRYARSTGNNPNKFAHQIGGTWDMTWDPISKNYGFGNTDFSSRWAMEPEKQPDGSPPLTGERTDDEVPPFSTQSKVLYASRFDPNHTGGNTLFYGTIDAGHFPQKSMIHRMSFYCRGSAYELANIHDTTVVLRIYVKAGNNLYQKPFNKNIILDPPNPPESSVSVFLPEPYIVRAVQLKNSPGTYRWITVDDFEVPGNKNISYYAVWTGAATVYCDRMIMFTDPYDRMFNPTQRTIPLPQPEPSLADQIIDKYAGLYQEPAFHSLYIDEPSLLATESFSHISDLVRSNLPGSSTPAELNGAIGPHTEWGLKFDQQFGKSTIDGEYSRKYLLYNVYPFLQDFDTTQSDVQTALDKLVKLHFIGDDTDQDYQYLGLRPAIRAANKFDTVSSNDIPIISILQVQAEHNVLLSGGSYRIDPAFVNGRRAPTRDEIFAQGNMALAYGAKGFMFYMVPTWNAVPGSNDTVFNTYGLFDEVSNHYLGEDGSGLVQNPCNAQEPNERYYAVKDLIRDTKKIENKILELKWLDAISWHILNECSIDWIGEIRTKYPRLDSEDDAINYVETGFFQDRNPASTNTIPSKYIYVVNRRCNESDPVAGSPTTDNSDRNVTLILSLDTNFRNYRISDLKTDSVYYTTNDGWVTIFLKAGHGTLLKIEPTIQTGGTLVTNETIRTGTYTVDTTLIVPQNVKLTINAGAKLTFMKSGKLLILDGQLEVKGTPTNKVEFDFVAKNWSAANGIFAYRTPLKISNAIIKNASCGIYSHISPGDTIDGVTTDSTHCGISLYYSYNYGADNTIIRNSEIKNSQLWGITMVGSRPRIHNNWFTNITEKAISASTGSAPILLRAADTVGNNRFQLNGTSIYAINSNPFLGTMDDKENYIGGNCFYEDTTSLWTVNETPGLDYEIDAYGNDWGTTDPSEFRIISGSGITVNTDGYNSDCSGIWSNPNMLSGGSVLSKQMESGGDPDSIKTLIKDVKRMIAQGQLRDALGILTDIINGTVDVRYKKSAVSLIPQCYEYVNLSELKSNLLSIRNVSGLFKFTTMLLMNVDTQNMDTYKQEILNAGNNKMYGAGDNSEEVMMIYNSLLEEKYKSSGVIDTVGIVTPILAYLNSNFPTSEYTKSANLLFSEVSNNSSLGNGPMNKPQVSGTKSEGIEYDYNLYNNYPNPFNPETVIKFSLKEKSNVTLTVFNIAGQKVAELVTGEMEKGMYEKRFNGTKFSSGVYIFRLNAQSLESTTHYSETMKALLLK